MMADDRTNSIIVLATQKSIDEIKDLIKEVDYDVEPGEDDIHVVRFPQLSTTAFLNRNSLIEQVYVCPGCPVHTAYGRGICVRESKRFGTWTIKLASGGEAHLHDKQLQCDARFVPLVEAGTWGALALVDL